MISANHLPILWTTKGIALISNVKPELNSVRTYLMLLLLLYILLPPFLLLAVLTHVSISPHLPSHSPSYLFFFLSWPYFISSPPLPFWLLLLVVLILILLSVPFLLCTRADVDQWIVSINGEIRQTEAFGHRKTTYYKNVQDRANSNSQAQHECLTSHW